MTETDTAVSVVCGICHHGFEAIDVPAPNTTQRRAWPIVFAMRFKELRCEKCKSGWRSLQVLSFHHSLSNQDLEVVLEHLGVPLEEQTKPNKPFLFGLHQAAAHKAAAGTLIRLAVFAGAAGLTWWLFS